jgi:hypothetical protein
VPLPDSPPTSPTIERIVALPEAVQAPSATEAVVSEVNGVSGGDITTAEHNLHAQNIPLPTSTIEEKDNPLGDATELTPATSSSPSPSSIPPKMDPKAVSKEKLILQRIASPSLPEAESLNAVDTVVTSPPPDISQIPSEAITSIDFPLGNDVADSVVPSTPDTLAPNAVHEVPTLLSGSIAMDAPPPPTNFPKPAGEADVDGLHVRLKLIEQRFAGD